jgi:hypothetical protein
MTSTLKQFKARAFARPKVKEAYDDLAKEFAFFDEVLKASAESKCRQQKRRRDLENNWSLPPSAVNRS